MARIIFADDDDIMAMLVVGALMDAGHGIGWVPNGARALEVMRQRPPHLAILDQNMPEMSGRAVLRAMRQDPALATVPVMMLTGIQGEADEKISYFDGADDYMTKPFDVDELVFRAEQLIARRMRRALPGGAEQTR